MTDDKKPSTPDLTRGVSLDDFVDSKLLGHVGEDEVLLVQLGPEVVAIDPFCSHYHGPLAEGLVVGDTIRCPWHHACFSLRTGEPLRAPALNPVTSYAVAWRDGSVFVTGKQERPGSVRRRAPSGGAPPSIGIVGAG